MEEATGLKASDKPTCNSLSSDYRVGCAVEEYGYVGESGWAMSPLQLVLSFPEGTGPLIFPTDRTFLSFQCQPFFERERNGPCTFAQLFQAGGEESTQKDL